MSMSDGMYSSGRKYITSKKQIVLRFNYDDPSMIYSDALQPQQRYTGKYGVMIGALFREQIVYVKKVTMRDVHKVDICSLNKKHKRTLTLQPPGGHTWSDCLSICEHPYSRWMAVVDGNIGNRTLDIFNERGEHCER